LGAFLDFVSDIVGFERGKGSGKREFSRGGSIETARFQRAKRREIPCLPAGRLPPELDIDKSIALCYVFLLSNKKGGFATWNPCIANYLSKK